MALKVLKPTEITDARFVSSVIAEPSGTDPTAAWSLASPYAAGQKVYMASSHRMYECLAAHQGVATSTATVTLTIAAPCVVTWTGHGKLANAPVVITTNGALPTGITSGTTYYVTAPAANTFNLSSVPGGPAITTTGTQTGTHTATTTSTSPTEASRTGANELWLDLGPTNRWAMFDTVISTGTRLTTSVGTPALTAVVAPGICNGVAVLDVSGAASVTVTMTNAGVTVYTRTQTLDNTFVSDWYQYFFEPYDVLSDILFGPLPPYPSAQITVTITPTSIGGVVSCGAVMFGNTVEIGEVEYGATAGITDYSRKETDEFGITTLVERGYSKRATYSMLVENSQLRRVFSTLAALRATPAVWIASDDYKFSPLTVFGPPKTWGINVRYHTHSSVSLEIEGLI